MRTIKQILESAGEKNIEDVILKGRFDFGYFVRHIRGLEYADFHHEIYKAMSRYRYSKIMVSRQHGKTTMAVSYILWQAFYLSHKDILVVSSTKDQSTKFLERVKEGIIDNELLARLKPTADNLFDPTTASDYKWASEEIWTSTKVKIFTRAFGSSIRGLSPNLVICDDILKSEETNSSISEDRAKDLFFGDIMPTVNTTRGRVVVIGTPISFTDLLSELTEEKGFHEVVFPAVITNEKGEWVKPLWDSRFTLDDWRAELKRVGSWMFSREYMCKPLASGGALFKGEILQKQAVGSYKYERDPNYQYYLGVDVAMSDASTADFTVMMTIAKDHDGKLYLVNKERFKGGDINYIINKIRELDNTWKYTYGLIESNSISYGIVKEITEKTDLYFIKGFTTNKQSKERIITQLQAVLERGQLIIPDDPSLIDELATFGLKKVNKTYRLESLGQHDDQVMALAFAVESAIGKQSIPVNIEWV